MSSRIPGEVLAARLRAHRLVPQQTPVRVIRLSRGRDAGLSWRAAHAVTGEDLRVASEVTVKGLLAAPRWTTEVRDGVTLVLPD